MFFVIVAYLTRFSSNTSRCRNKPLDILDASANLEYFLFIGTRLGEKMLLKCKIKKKIKRTEYDFID